MTNTNNKSKPDLFSPNTSPVTFNNKCINIQKCENKQKTLRFCANFQEVNGYMKIQNDTLKEYKKDLIETIQTEFFREFSKMSPKQRTGILKIIYCCISGYWLHKEYTGEIFSIGSRFVKDEISCEHGPALLEPFFIIDNNNFSKGIKTKKGTTMGYKYSERLKRTIETYSLNEDYIQEVNLNNAIKINVKQGIKDAKLLIELIVTGEISKYNQIFKPKKDITSIDELKIRKNKLIMILENVNVDEYKPANSGREYLQSDSNLQMLNSELRNRLFSGLGYFDIDMENSHYSLLLNWLIKEKFDTSKFIYLKKYIGKRPKVIGELSDRYQLTPAKVKELLLALLNSGLNNFKNSAFENVYYDDIKLILQDDFIVSLKLEINEIKEIVYYYYGGEKKEKQKVMSDLLQKLESDILNIICTEYAKTIILKMFDGWISNKEMNLNGIIKKIVDQTGFRINFKQVSL